MSEQQNTTYIDSVLDDPKGELQYALLKLQYALIETLSVLVEQFEPISRAIESLWPVDLSTQDTLRALGVMSPQPLRKSSFRAPQYLHQTTYTKTPITRSRSEIRTIRRKRH